jgi:integrase
MLLTYLDTAGRRNEIFQLTWNDIDFNQNTISLNTRKREQGNFEIDQIPLHDKLKTPLLQWKQDQPIKNDYVFICISSNQIGKPHKQYGKPFKNRQHFMKGLCKKAGVTGVIPALSTFCTKSAKSAFVTFCTFLNVKC